MKKIIVLGSTNTDMVVKSARIPAPGETVLGGDFLMNPGGKGANQAVAAARLGGNVTLIAKVGNDLFGREARAIFEREGIQTDYLYVDEQHPSGVALIMVDAQGENCISVASGANATLSPEDICGARHAIETADALLCQLETPLSTILEAARWAAAKKIPVILNPAPACVLPDELYPCIDILTPNEHEIELLTGIAVTDLRSAESAARAVCQRGVRCVIITLGAKGAYFFSGERGTEIPAFPVKAIDTTAAGDVFNGALVVALTEGKPVETAARFAAQAASIAVTRMGAQSSAPRREEMCEQ